MISYLGSLVQFSPAAGRAGRCRQKSLCVGSTRPVLARQPAVLAPSPRCCAPFPSAASGLGSQGFVRALPRARCAFSLRGPSVHRRSGLRMASLGLSLPLSPLPAFYLQRGWGGSSLEFLSPFVLRTAGGVFRLVNFSLSLPQFKKISLRLFSGPSGRSLP